MSEQFSVGMPPIDVRVRRHPRARRMTLRIAQGQRLVSLTMPTYARLHEAQAFARSKEDWLRARLQSQPAVSLLEPGDTLPILGEQITLASGSHKKPTLDGAVLNLAGQGDDFRVRLSTYLKHRAREELVRHCDHYAAQIGKSYTKFTLRDPRTRWGSCSSNGGLMFSWRLILAPAEVLTYVAVHEVAHLAHMDHSKAFWGCVGGLMPTYQIPRAWLRNNGSLLHSYQFN